MYRPTVRMDDAFKKWIDDLFAATRLDRNQIIRLALFSAWESETFKKEIEAAKRDVTPLPLPRWKGSESWLWQGQQGKKMEGGRDVNAAKTWTNGGPVGASTEGNRVLQPNDNRPKRTNARPMGAIRPGNAAGRMGAGSNVIRENGGIRIIVR